MYSSLILSILWLVWSQLWAGREMSTAEAKGNNALFPVTAHLASLLQAFSKIVSSIKNMITPLKQNMFGLSSSATFSLTDAPMYTLWGGD